MGSLSIVPLGPVKDEILGFLKSELAIRFNLNVSIARCEQIPEDAYSQRREQYHSTRILERLEEMEGNDGRILGIIDVDIYVSGLNFNFGEADIEGGVCLISLTRLRQEFYGLEADKRLFLERALKEAVHELGHTYGLRHCPDPKCIMHFSNSLADTDIKGPDFCPRCKVLLG